MAYGPMPVSVALQRCEEIIRSARSRSRVEASTLCQMAILQAMALRVQDARVNLAESRSIYQELGMSLEAAASSQALAAIEMLAGDPGLAVAELRKDGDLLGDIGGHAYLVTTELRLAQVLDTLGRHDEARSTAERVGPSIPADDVVGQAQLASLRVHALAADGRDREAEDLARRALTAARATDRFDVFPTALVDLADVLSNTHRRVEALELLDRSRALHLAKENAASLAKVEAKRSELHA